MEPLYKYINESENKNSKQLVNDWEEFVKFLNNNCSDYIVGTGDNKKLRITSRRKNIGYMSFSELKKVFDYATTHKKKSPVVIYYANNKTFVFRRWVGNECYEYFENFDIVNGGVGTPYKGLHDTKLKEDGFWTPEAADFEPLIVYAHNISILSTSSKKNLSLDESVAEMAFAASISKSNAKVKLLLDYYNDNVTYINGMAKNLPRDDGKFRKLGKENSVTPTWLEYGEFNERSSVRRSDGTPRAPRADNTPKTDIISENSKYRISLKKASGSQLMSGKACESLATIKTAVLATYPKYPEDENARALIDYLFNDPDDPGKKDWGGNISAHDENYADKRLKMQTRNKSMTAKIVKFINDVEDDKSPKFKKNIMMEAATGATKFGPGSDATANSVLIWDEKTGTSEFKDIGAFVDEHVKKAEFIISLKTAGRDITFTALRISI